MSRLRLTLRQLQSFVAIAREGSTSNAAEATALSQSATSAALSELERLLGLLLFDRVGKRLLLNDNGRALLPRAQALLDGAANIEQMASEADTSSLRIGASSTIGNHVLPHFLQRLLPTSSATGKPLLRVRIANSESICAALVDFELDVGLIEGPSHHSELEATPWLTDELLLVAAPNLIKANAPLNTQQLRDSVWLLREPGSGTREITDQLLLAHLGQYRHCIELGSSEAILSAAAQGLGLACLSHWVVQNALMQGQLVKLTTHWPPLQRQCYLVMHRQKQATVALQRFIRLAQDWLATSYNGLRL